MSDAARTALASVLAEAGWRADAGGLAIAEGASGVASSLPFSDIAAGAYGALALAAARFGEMRGGGALTPKVDRRHAGLALVGNAYLTIDGEAPQTWGNITGYYRCGDGEWVYLHGIFPHLRDGLLELFEAEDARDAMAARLADWTADAAEAEGQARGLCVMKVRSRAAWDAHAQRAALAAQPLIDARRLSDVEALAPRGRISPQSGGRARPDRAEGAKPLAGMRALDLTRVIAGPMAGRALAELGADVLRVSAAHLPSIEALVVDTGFGKRNAEIDLRTDAGRETLRTLVAGADILIDGYRPGALAAKGFGAADLAAINPDLTLVEISAFSDVGPWAGRRGYDTYVQAGVGFTAPIGPDDRPSRLPCQPLDYLTGCLAAFGAVLGLIRREETGGGSQVDLSLARTAMWIWEMADAVGPEPAPPAQNPKPEEIGGLLRTMSSDFGDIASLAPPYGFREVEVNWETPPRALGADPPEWRERRMTGN